MSLPAVATRLAQRADTKRAASHALPLTGTVCCGDALLFLFEAADPALGKELANPYSLCPAGYRPKARQPNVKFAEFDADFGAWIAPFVMSAINTRIVQRSNALLEQAYGKDFTYDEATLTGRGLPRAGH